MKLYFQRHGLADWPHWQGPDDERPLNPDGIAQLKAQAGTLQALGLELDAIIASPLPRAQQTAEIVAAALGMEVATDRNLAPGFSIEKLPGVLKPYRNAKAVMVVGHESDFSECISTLIGGGLIVLKKGGLARVDLGPGEPLRGQLAWLLTPKLLNGK